MSLRVPSDDELTLVTARLVLEPVLVSHAGEMAAALADAALYTFIPFDPVSAEVLAARISKWEARISLAGDELWLNWAARIRDTGELIGHFQATFRSSTESSIAYTVAVAEQRRGFAREAVSAMIEYMKASLGAAIINAWVDTRNQASIALVGSLGFVAVETLLKADHFKGADSDEFVFALKL